MTGRRSRVVVAGRVALPFGVLLAWVVLSHLFGETVVPSPVDTFAAVRSGLRAGWLSEDLVVTLITLLQAYLLAVVVAVPAGVVIGYNRTFRDVMEPVILGSYSIPKVTLYPIFLIGFGITMNTRIAFGTFNGVFPIMILTMSGMTAVSTTHVKVGQSFNASSWQLFRHVIFPSILPFLVTGLRIGFSLTFIGVILAEMFTAYSGLGNQLLSAMRLGQITDLYALILVISIVGVAGNTLFYVAESRIRGPSDADVTLSAL